VKVIAVDRGGGAAVAPCRGDDEVAVVDDVVAVVVVAENDPVADAPPQPRRRVSARPRPYGRGEVSPGLGIRTRYVERMATREGRLRDSCSVASPSVQWNRN